MSQVCPTILPIADKIRDKHENPGFELGWLVVFYGISTLEGYSIPNSVDILNIHYKRIVQK